jgi:hypothetical protein
VDDDQYLLNRSQSIQMFQYPAGRPYSFLERPTICMTEERMQRRRGLTDDLSEGPISKHYTDVKDQRNGHDRKKTIWWNNTEMG